MEPGFKSKQSDSRAVSFGHYSILPWETGPRYSGAQNPERRSSKESQSQLKQRSEQRCLLPTLTRQPILENSGCSLQTSLSASSSPTPTHPTPPVTPPAGPDTGAQPGAPSPWYQNSLRDCLCALYEGLQNPSPEPLGPCLQGLPPLQLIILLKVACGNNLQGFPSNLAGWQLPYPSRGRPAPLLNKHIKLITTTTTFDSHVY